METMGSILLNPCQPRYMYMSPTILAQPKHKLHHHGGAKALSGSMNRLECKNSNRASSFNYRGNAGVPIHELPWASFDQYIEDKGRVIRTIFPEKLTSHQQLNEDEWRVKMTPFPALFLTCQPVIHITAKCISEANDYPPEIPAHITKLLEVHIIRCEFPDLHPNYMPVDFKINGRAALYLERQGRGNWMKNQMYINLNMIFPPLLAWVPEYVLQNIVQTVLKNYVEDINNGFAVRLLADYNSFKRNKSKYMV